MTTNVILVDGPKTIDTVYLGDGAYADFTDWSSIRVYADRAGITHEVFLEGRELQALFDFAKSKGWKPK